MRRSDRINRAARAFACALGLLCPALGVAQDRPQRVVSINLCTDQLALMISAPGQLISVSDLAQDPRSSAMADAAQALPTNGSTAEEVFLLKPDLVLAGTFNSAATIDLLRDLGIPVVQFAPARSISDVPKLLVQMGDALGQQEVAVALIAAFRKDMDALAQSADTAPRAALTYVNNYSSGDKTLAGDILRIAGFHNVATDAGLSSVGTLSLEQLVLLAPDVVIQGRNYPGEARAEDNLNHPALRALDGTTFAGELTDRDWICGTPQVMHAIKTIRALRQSLDAAQ